jgi:hypothetical protein
MDRAKIIAQIADVGRRLTELSNKHRVAMKAGDRLLINDLKAEIRRLQEFQHELEASIPAKPPGLTGRPVR